MRINKIKLARISMDLSQEDAYETITSNFNHIFNDSFCSNMWGAAPYTKEAIDNINAAQLSIAQLKNNK